MPRIPLSDEFCETTGNHKISSATAELCGSSVWMFDVAEEMLPTGAVRKHRADAVTDFGAHIVKVLEDSPGVLLLQAGGLGSLRTDMGKVLPFRL